MDPRGGAGRPGPRGPVRAEPDHSVLPEVLRPPRGPLARGAALISLHQLCVAAVPVTAGFDVDAAVRTAGAAAADLGGRARRAVRAAVLGRLHRAVHRRADGGSPRGRMWASPWSTGSWTPGVACVAAPVRCSASRPPTRTATIALVVAYGAGALLQLLGGPLDRSSAVRQEAAAQASASASALVGGLRVLAGPPSGCCTGEPRWSWPTGSARPPPRTGWWCWSRVRTGPWWPPAAGTPSCGRRGRVPRAGGWVARYRREPRIANDSDRARRRRTPWTRPRSSPPRIR